ncbi:MAG: shikimate dehydrogenase, partial [Oscillospiraceae bacterium]
MEKRISGTTKVMALIGSPVGHSGSPAMYNYCFQKDGYDGAYVAFDVTLDTLKDAMAGIKALNLQGINITMPCKSAVIEYLDEISPAAKLIGACNVAVNKDGRWQGHNTDGIGFVENLKAHGVDVAGKNLCVIGAGGAGTAIIVQCALSGAKSISVFNLKDPF